MSRPSSDLELLIRLDRGTGPLHRQIERQVESAIRSGALAAGAAMPSSRQLADQLGVSRGVVIEAYGQLIAGGYLMSEARRAPRVADVGDHSPSSQSRRLPPPKRFDYDLRPGRPSLETFPRAAWSRALRRAVQSTDDSSFGYPDPGGHPALRASLAEYLGRVRGVATSADNVIVTQGATQGIGLIGRALASRGFRAVGLEDPSHRDQRALMEGAGLEVVPVAVDADGLQVSALAPSRAETVLVTPAHQFPTGVLMSPSRRSQLISWVDESDRYVLEDDYDAEFRFAGSPVGAIQGLRPDRVVYIGSTSKALSPALRIGWVIVPQDLHDDVVRLKRYADLGSPTVPQLALADLIDSGDYDRHLRRVRQLYGKRRRAVVRAVERGFPGADVLGIEAGLHVAIRVEALDERRFQQLAEQQASVAIGVLGEHAIKFQPASALLLGFAAETENRLQVAVNRLAKLL